jgi:outer membrane protein OmpA-like peptidoglycan-associated protein
MLLMSQRLVIGGLLLGLGACTTALPPEKTTALGGPFNEQLKQGYVHLASARWAAWAPSDWYHFRSKAYQAEDGDVVWPDKVSSREIPEADRAEAIELRERLLTALELGGRAAAPTEAAAAQANFDCWLVQLASAKKPAETRDCKENFVAALDKTENALVKDHYQVLFAPGSDQLDPDAMNVVTAVARAARVARPARVDVVGYADSSGAPAANEALSRRRADAVAAALGSAGVPRDALLVGARGATGEAAGAQARRVEITFSG